jgi:hypothetical protein
MAKRTRPTNGVNRRYSWRLYCTEHQDAILRAQGAMCAELWNALLDMCERRYQRAVQRHGSSISFHCAGCAHESEQAGKFKLCDAHKHPTEFNMGYWISEMLEQCPEWRKLSTWTPRRVATSVSMAWRMFFQRAKAGHGKSSGRPLYKSPRRHLAIPHRCVSGCQFTKSNRHEKSWWLRLKGVPGEIWARGEIPTTVNEWTDADVRYRDGHWEVSAAMAVTPRREAGSTPITVRFDLVDCFAMVNGHPETPQAFRDIERFESARKSMQTSFDLRWPRGRRCSDAEWQERCEAKAEISKLCARIARIRGNALHVWTKRIVGRASDLTIIMPPIKKMTTSPRGNAREWGAEVETVSELNRTALSYAPGMAAAMLQYKAKEAEIGCDLITDEDAPIAVGADLAAASKAVRRAKRTVRKEAERKQHERKQDELRNPIS